jgi:CubicO group peptidase (beta-lactamase class C family)
MSNRLQIKDIIKSFTRLCLLVIAAVFLFSPSLALAQDKNKKIEELLTLYHKYGQFNGAVLVSDGGKVVYQKGFGLANMELGVPNTADTKFRIGSITKSFTLTLVFQLIEQGKLKLDGKLTDYLPEFPKAKGEKVTVNQLLTHTAGFKDIGDFPRNSNDFPAIVAKMHAGFVSNDELVKMISGYDLLFEPGTSFRYSNDGYILLGAIVERVTGKSYEDVLKEQILIPSGMKNTGMAYHTRLLPNRATGYEHTFNGYENAADFLVAANGGMYSTVGDLFLFKQALSTDKLLSQKSKDVMFSVTPYVVAYGWKVRKVTDERAGKVGTIIIASGLIPGFIAFVVEQVDTKRLVILLTNVREFTPRVGDINDALMNILDGKKYDLPKRSLAATLYTIVKEKGISSTLEQYRVLSRNNTYYLNESEFNDVGYALIREKRIKEAIEIFKLNTEANPQSANAFDSLGEAYMFGGDKERAIASYQKSVELNPQNTNAIEMLKKLRQQ